MTRPGRAPIVVVARFRPTLVVQRAAAAGLGALHLGPLVPREVSRSAMRAALSALWTVRAPAVSPGGIDVATDTPLLDTARARRELGRVPRHGTAAGARELLDGLADGAVGATAALGAR